MPLNPDTTCSSRAPSGRRYIITQHEHDPFAPSARNASLRCQTLLFGETFFAQVMFAACVRLRQGRFDTGKFYKKINCFGKD
jgi:hypothetical protein